MTSSVHCSDCGENQRHWCSVLPTSTSPTWVWWRASGHLGSDETVLGRGTVWETFVQRRQQNSHDRQWRKVSILLVGFLLPFWRGAFIRKRLPHVFGTRKRTKLCSECAHRRGYESANLHLWNCVLANNSLLISGYRRNFGAKSLDLNPATTNACESYHAHLNADLYSAQPNI